MFAKMRNLLARNVPYGLKGKLKVLLGQPLTNLHRDWKILTPVGPNYSEHVVIDVGAHHGWFFHCWLDWCPNARVYAFEPYGESYEEARKLYGSDPRVYLRQLALGDRCGSIELNVLERSKVSNSFLIPRDEVWKEIRYETGKIDRATVQVVPLDDHLEHEDCSGIYLLKIDVQGYEMHVLRGAQRSLARVDHILVESAIRPLYHGAARFSEVFDFLTANDFHLIAMQGWHRGNHALVEADMLFRRNDLMPPVDESTVRMTQRFG